MQFFTLGSSKIEDFETYFCDIVATQYDHPRYVKHVVGRCRPYFHDLHPIGVLGPWGGGGGSQGIGTQPAYAVFHPGSSKVEDFETYFFDMVTTQYDHPRYVKHVLGCIYMIFTLFGY